MWNVSFRQDQLNDQQLAMGWHKIAPLPTYQFLLRADRILQRRIPNRLFRAVVARGLIAFQRLKQLAGGSSRARLRAPRSVEGAPP